MAFAVRSHANWMLRTRSLPVGERTLVMGVLNVTPDSFSDGGAFQSPARAIEHGLAMFDEGADIVDIGGESTRPGKRDPVGVQQEIDRVLPVFEGILRHRPGSVLSIDTYKSSTAGAALRAGAEIVNDVSGFLWDEAMPPVCSKYGCGVVLMHTRGRPEEWHTLGPLPPKEISVRIERELRQLLQKALEAGVDRNRIVLDPGFGFGKVLEENYFLLAALENLSRMGFPLLTGVSRKGFLGRSLAPLYGGTDAPIDRRANASVAAATSAILAGSHLVRVHDVRATREAAAIADAILLAGLSL